MLSALRREKLGRFFDLLDVDDSGWLERSDLRTIVQRRASQDQGDPDPIGRAEGEALVGALWMALYQVMDDDQDERVSRREWMIYWEGAFGEMEGEGFSALPLLLRGIYHWMLGAFDLRGRSYVTSEDYRRFLMPYGAGVASRASEAFARVDRDGDGSLSVDEMRICFSEFFLSDAPDARGNHLFG